MESHVSPDLCAGVGGMNTGGPSAWDPPCRPAATKGQTRGRGSHATELADELLQVALLSQL